MPRCARRLESGLLSPIKESAKLALFYHSILKFSCMIRGGPALEIVPKLALSMLVAGPPKCFRFRMLKKSAPSLIWSLSRTRGKYFSNEIASSEYVQPRTLGSVRGAFPKLNGAGSVNAARFRYRSVAGLKPPQLSPVRIFAPERTLG